MSNTSTQNKLHSNSLTRYKTKKNAGKLILYVKITILIQEPVQTAIRGIQFQILNV